MTKRFTTTTLRWSENENHWKSHKPNISKTHSSPLQGSPTSRIYHLMIWGGADVVITQIKCIMNVMHMNHPETISSPFPQSMEKLSSTKLAPGAKKVGDLCFKVQKTLLHCDEMVMLLRCILRFPNRKNPKPKETGLKAHRAVFSFPALLTHCQGVFRHRKLCSQPSR